MTEDDWKALNDRVDAMNREKGQCLRCGGSGVIADLGKMDRTGDPFANRRCRRCKGTGKIHPNDAKPKKAAEPAPHA